MKPARPQLEISFTLLRGTKAIINKQQQTNSIHTNKQSNKETNQTIKQTNKQKEEKTNKRRKHHE